MRATLPSGATSTAGLFGSGPRNVTTATVLYGANGRYVARVVAGGTALACNNATFTDPLVGTAKACWLR